MKATSFLIGALIAASLIGGCSGDAGVSGGDSIAKELEAGKAAATNEPAAGGKGNRMLKVDPEKAKSSESSGPAPAPQ